MRSPRPRLPRPEIVPLTPFYLRTPHPVLRRYTRRNKELPPADEKHVSTFGLSFTSGCLLIGFWAAILLLVIVARDQTTYDDWKYLHIFETFFRIGSIIFGGGQVRGRSWDCGCGGRSRAEQRDAQSGHRE